MVKKLRKEKMDTVTLPPTKNVDAATVKKLRTKVTLPVSMSLIVRAGLTHLANMSEQEYYDTIAKQYEIEHKNK